MSDSDFEKLVYATRVFDKGTWYYQETAEWKAKRDTLHVQLVDIPTLLKAHETRRKDRHPNNLDITLTDHIPTIRLANALEATANGLYSMAEIASNFANEASKGALPSSFNKLRKRCEADPSLRSALGDLQWYRKIRELRTEWAHYSSVFIADDPSGTTTNLVARAYRRRSDRTEFQGPTFSCTVGQFVGWVESALATLDSFAGYLLDTFIVPTMGLDQTFLAPVYDKSGFPIIRENHTFVVETISVREYLKRGGILAEG
jgi:hypothetical protein